MILHFILYNGRLLDAIAGKEGETSGGTVSPLTTMGMAGGQETAGAAQMRPTASAAGIISCGARTASRMVKRRGCASSARPMPRKRQDRQP